MTIGIDQSPLTNGNFQQHIVRGAGFYIKNLQKALLKYSEQNTYVFFSQSNRLSRAVDVVHVPYFEPFFFTMPLVRKFPTIITIHDFIPFIFPSHFPAGLRGNITWQFQKFLLRGIDGIITDSVASKNDIVKHANIPKEKIYVVYLAADDKFKYAIDLDSEAQRVRRKYSLPEKFILYVGDATWNKNLPRLIEAASKIDIPLVLVGKALVNQEYDKTNPWNKDLVLSQKLVKQNKKIITAGFIPTEDLVFLYHCASVFVMPSLYEGFGLPVLEAMSCGCPVVTTKNGSLAEVAGKACWIVDPFDIDNIADGIQRVFTDTKLQKILSEKGREQAKKFSWKKTAFATLTVYKQICGNV